MHIHLERCAAVTATPHTTWAFAVLGDGEGTATTVEVTFPDRSEEVVDALAGMVEALRAADVADEAQIEGFLGFTRCRLRADPALAAAVSALGARHGRAGRRPAAGARRPRGRLARRPDRAGRADRGRPAAPRVSGSGR